MNYIDLPCGRSGGPRRARSTSLAMAWCRSRSSKVLYSRPRLVTKGREDVTLVFGTTDAGRHLVVVLADADDGRLFVVTARAMADPERRAFARRAR
jgi:hypothetical protein